MTINIDTQTINYALAALPIVAVLAFVLRRFPKVIKGAWKKRRKVLEHGFVLCCIVSGAIASHNLFGLQGEAVAVVVLVEMIVAGVIYAVKNEENGNLY